MKHLKTILIISVLLNLLAAFFVVRRIYYQYYLYAQHEGSSVFFEDPKTKNSRVHMFELLKTDSNSIVFMGTSLTQGFELAELLNDRNIKNRGVNGDKTSDLLKRLQPILSSPPKKIFIEIGINDIGHGVTTEKIIANYKKIIDTLSHTCPQTKIYVQSILPTENNIGNKPSYCNPKVNEEIQKINKEIKTYATGKGITFIDTYSQFVLKDELNQSYSDDGVHLSAEGYLLWAEILNPFVKE